MRRVLGSWVHTNLSGPGATGFIRAWSWLFGRDGRRPLAFLWAAAYLAGTTVVYMRESLWMAWLCAADGILVVGMTAAWAVTADPSTDGGGEAAMSGWVPTFLDMLAWVALFGPVFVIGRNVPMVACELCMALWLSTMLSDKGTPGKPVWRRLRRHSLAPVGAA